MSADNTVIVVETRGKSGSRAEYRVAHVQALENMDYDADYPSRKQPVVNRSWMLETFEGKPVFTDANEALEEAKRLEKWAEGWVGYVEYGIRVIDLSHIFFPSTQPRRGRRPPRNRLQSMQSVVHR